MSQRLTINAALTHNNSIYQNKSDVINEPMDPPPFERLPIRMCATSELLIKNIEGKQKQWIHVPFTAMKHVEEFLEDERARQQQEMGVGVNNNIYDDDDDSLSDFDEEDEGEDQEMEESSDSGSDFDSSHHGSEVDEGGEASGSQQHPSRPQDARQRDRPNNNLIAYWIPPMKEFLIQENERRGHLRTFVHRAVVLEKTDLGWITTDERVVIKSMSWEHVLAGAENNTVTEDILTEIDALQYLSNVIEGINGQSHVLTANTIMGDDSKVYIVMPYCDSGDIYQRVVNSNRLTEAECKYWFRQMLTGIRTLQTACLCHRDLSPENFVILDNATLVIDFGMCLRIPYTEDGTRRHLISRQRPCGKLPHMAPEILYHLPFDGHAVDLYSAGTVLLYMLTGKRLKGGIERGRELLEYFNPSEWGLSEDATDLLRRMLRLNPIDRLTLDEIWTHPFLNA